MNSNQKHEDESLKSKGYQMLIIGNYLVFYVVFKNKKNSGD